MSDQDSTIELFDLLLSDPGLSVEMKVVAGKLLIECNFWPFGRHTTDMPKTYRTVVSRGDIAMRRWPDLLRPMIEGLKNVK